MKKIILYFLLFTVFGYAKELRLEDFQNLKPIQERKVTVTAFKDIGDWYIIKGTWVTRKGRVKGSTALITKDLKYTIFNKVWDNQTNSKVFFPQDMTKYKKNAHFSYGEGTQEFYIFSDPECPYCIKFEKALLKANLDKKIKLYYFLYPLEGHENAKAKVNYILTQKEPYKAMLDVMLHNSTEYKKYPNTKTEALKKIDEMVLEIVVKGTPTIFTPQGRIISSLDFIQEVSTK